MKKLIILCALVVTGIISYTLGYYIFSFDISEMNLYDRKYIMPDIPETIEEEYILYPYYGEIMIYNLDGEIYDNTGVYLNDLSKEEQITLLRCDRTYTINEINSYIKANKRWL